MQKLFPATLALVDALAGPFPDVVLLPTGGIDADNAREFLRRPNVAAVAGTWIAPRRLIAEHAWAEIDQRARAARRARDHPLTIGYARPDMTLDPASCQRL